MRSESHRSEGDLLLVALLAVVCGAATGLMVAIFRLTLADTNRWRGDLIAQAHRIGLGAFFLVVVGCAAAAATAAWLVRRFSTYASGSGIPEVEAALAGTLPPAPVRRILLVKFIGGILSIGGGMALGPEGPGAQMGAVSGRLLGNLFRRARPDVQALVAAGAGAGIGVAFNAPVAGAVFVLEELVRRFEMRIAVAALGAAATAILVSRLFLGGAPEFHVVGLGRLTAGAGPLSYAGAATWPLYLALGALAGIAAAFYNWLIINGLSVSDRFHRWPAEAKAAAIGAVVGAIGWFAPKLIGAGDNIAQLVLDGGVLAGEIPLFLAIRFFLGPASYAARTPGGLFAPLLVLGALIGFLLGALCQRAFPALAIEPQAFAVVGMAAFFTGVVRAPITGIVLVIEMTAAFETLLPILVACFAAMVAADLLNVPPIYDSLRERLAAELKRGRTPPTTAETDRGKKVPSDC
ncbi:MAG: chloride channel protein [Caulobacteraceae bacterium]